MNDRNQLSDEERRRRTEAVQEFCTNTLFDFLTSDLHERKTLEFLEEGAGLALGKRVRLTGEGVISGGEVTFRREGEGSFSVADNLLHVTRTRLAHSFAEDSPDAAEEGTWAANAAFACGIMVDYSALADRLLRKYVPEYVPPEVGGPARE
jgi:hypothetical protein